MKIMSASHSSQKDLKTFLREGEKLKAFDVNNVNSMVKNQGKFLFIFCLYLFIIII